jgi:hypothetical protein
MALGNTKTALPKEIDTRSGRAWRLAATLGGVLVTALALGCSEGAPEADNDESGAYEIKVQDGTDTEAGGTGGFSVDNAASLKAFTESFHPLVKEHCGGCHGVSTSPPFAVDDAAKAHKTVIEFHLASPTAPASSRIVNRLSLNNHNCWSQCPNDATEMLDAVKAWFDGAGITGAGGDLTSVGPVPVADAHEIILEGGGGGNWVREAENSYSIGAAFEGKDDSTASDGKVLHRIEPEDFPDVQPPPERLFGEVVYEFNIPEGDAYQLWIRARDVGRGGGIQYRINGGQVAAIDCNGSTRELTNNQQDCRDDWRWFPVFRKADNTGPEMKPLTPLGGSGVVTLAIVESDPDIDMIAFTTNESFDRGLVENSGKRNALEWDLEPALGKKVTFRMLLSPGLDGASYLLSNPTLVFADTAKVHVARIFVLNNNEFNPQYSTFASIDAEASSTTELSPRGLVVKQIGDDDELTLGFGKLELVE